MPPIVPPTHRVVVEKILEEVPNVLQRTGPRIGDQYLGVKSEPGWTVAWDVVRDFSPIGGQYGFQDRADTMGRLPITSLESDMIHWAVRWTLDPARLMFLQLNREGPIGAKIDYGTGPAADSARAKDVREVSAGIRQMGVAMANAREYVQIHSLGGRIVWPPVQNDGTAIDADDLPRQMGRMKTNYVVPILAAGSDGSGGYKQTATGLTGVAGWPAATGVPWTTAATANAIWDLTVIQDLMEERSSLVLSNMEMICATRTLLYCSQQAAVRDIILGASRDRILITESTIREEFATQFDFTVRKYNSKWEYVNESDWGTENPDVHSVRFLRQGRVILVPKPDIMKLGYLATGPAPGPAHQWNSGMYYWAHRDSTPPWTSEAGFGIFMWPVILNENTRFVLDTED